METQNAYFLSIIIIGQARTAKKCFASSEGDHLTLINVYRTSIELLEKRNPEVGKEKPEKALRKWCKENFINSRSLRHARDIHRLDTQTHLYLTKISHTTTIIT